MALYTIGDLHLSEGKNKPMGIFGDNWDNHSEKLRGGFAAVNDEDVTVLCGDISWGMGLEETGPDFLFIDKLPGKKIILKGNHDYWWSTASKAKKYFDELGIKTISILYNNSFTYGDISICGTRGWFYEEDKNGEHDKKIMMREIGRLKYSLDSADDRDKLVFLHYPPIFQKYVNQETLDLLRDYSVSKCYYGHIHGKGCAAAFNGWHGCTKFQLVSADYLDFTPIKVLD